MSKSALIVILVVTAVALTGCKKYFAPTPPTPPVPISQIEILSHESKTEEWGQEWRINITGTVKNNGNQTCSVWLAARLYNYSDIMVAESVEVLNDMSSGEVRQFSIYWFGEKIKRYEMVVMEVR